MKNNRVLWIVLGVVGALGLLCCMAVAAGVLLFNFVNISDRSASPLGMPTFVTTIEVERENRPAFEVSPTVEPTAAPTEEQALATNTPEPTEAVVVTEAPLVSAGGDSDTGEREEAGPAAVTLVGVTNVPDFSGFTPASGWVYLDVEVSLENTGADTLSYSPANFKIYDAAGTRFDHSFQSVQPFLSAGELAAGAEAQGHITFEVQAQPGDALRLVFTYAGDDETAEFDVVVP